MLFRSGVFKTSDDTPDVLKTPAQRALFNNLGKDAQLAILIDAAIRKSKRDGFRGNLAKEREVKLAIYSTLKNSMFSMRRKL